MSLTPATITQQLMNARFSGPHQLDGPVFKQFAQGLGNGISSWAVGNPVNLQLLGTATGTVGAGVINAPTTQIIVPPNPALVQSGLLAGNLNGPLSASLATVVAIGVASAFNNSAQYQGTSGGVGVGSDVSRVVLANTATLTAILITSLGGAFGAVGAALTSLAQGLAQGITNMLLTGTGVGTVTGPTGPSPGAGSTFSVVV